jgi:signal transduction histidine kinase
MTIPGLQFLNGGGEMGERMRAFDWASTGLGTPEHWPQSLKTIVRVMLDSRFAMWMAWGPQGTFFCNDAYLPTVGIKRSWVLGARADRVWAEIWHDIGPRIGHVLSTATATWDEGLQLFLERSGYPEETFHTFSYSPVYDDASRVAGMLCVVVEDTERVIGERRLRLLRDLAAIPTNEAASVAEAGERLLAALARGAEDVPFAVLYLSEQGSDAAERAASTQAAAALLAPASLALDEDAAVWPVGRTILHAREQRIDRFAERCGAVHGAWPDLVQNALSIPLVGSGQPRPFGALVVGISPRKKLDERYHSFLSLLAAQVASRLGDTQAHLQERRRAEALAELDRAKNTFFSNVSHEFRTPLTLMLGPIETLLERADLPAAAREPLQLVQRNGLRMRKLVNSLLDFSRIEAGRVEASYRATDLAALTRDLASVFRSAVEGAGLQLVVDCSDLGEPVYVDRDMWEKVVLNLLSNAFKFTFEGEIGLSLALGDNVVELRVHDTGVGIDSMAIDHIFDRFHRVAGARSRSQEGTGIGLALVKELVRLHGGGVSVHSEVDRGTTFRVSIPRGSAHLPADRIDADGDLAATSIDPSAFLDDGLRAGSASPLGAGSLALAAGIPPGAVRRERVLVVDDNADMRSYVQRLLAPHWDIVVAADGLQALRMIEENPPALVITDVMMPGLDGFGLVERIRANAGMRALPVILLSAQAGEEARLAGLNSGADDYLVKPFSSRELIARAEVQLMRARMRRIEEVLDRRLADVFRNAPVGVAILRGADHTFEFANAGYRNLVSNREVLGLPLLEALPELEGQGIRELLDEVRASGEAHIGRALPLQMLNPAQGHLESRFFDFVYQPISDDDSPSGSIAIVCFDVTELMLARQAAESASRAKDEFIAMLGHELRNPLAPISTALQLMKLQWADVAVRERGIIERQLQHMVRLVDDLLDVARITRGNIELRKSVVEMSQVVAKAVETTTPIFEQRHQQLVVDVPRHGLEVEVDPQRMVQVIANLLTNAAKFTATGKAIVVGAGLEDGQVIVRVRDPGIGMTPAELGVIFNMFVQGGQELHRPRGGLGLGLTIARNLAALHGGALSAHSDGPDAGSTFTLSVPLHVQSARAIAADAPLPPQGVNSAGKKILIVDDNVDAALTLSELLQMWGYQTRVVHDAPAALELLAASAVDIALLDIGLPVMDGYELARRIRNGGSGNGIRLIALTGYGQAAAQKQSWNSGFDAHLVKPVDLDKLVEALSPA